jgi:hypothetical protein
MPSMQPQRIDIGALIEQPADRGRTCWTWRAPCEEGPVNIDHDAFRKGGYLPRAILSEQPADPRDGQGEPNEILKQWVSTYMVRAYPRGGRTRARSN